jgi:hypothetical protein
MSSLKSSEKVVFEKLFDRGGYVLDFNEPRYAEFFREHQIDINHERYQINGSSKMKRLRAFWELDEDILVFKVLTSLLQYAEAIETVDKSLKEKALDVLKRLEGKSKPVKESTESEFLGQNFFLESLNGLNVDSALLAVLEQRLTEIQQAMKAGASLAAILLCGSTLEGLLLDVASKNPRHFNQALSAPKLNDQVRPLYEWTLESLINVAYEVKVISLDVKKYSHSLRDFRNFIHPRQQAASGFIPDHHTARISWQVLQAAIADLRRARTTS